MLGVEVEISASGEDDRRSHKEVLEREINGRPAYTAVFDNVPAGRYTLWVDDIARERGVARHAAGPSRRSTGAEGPPRTQSERCASDAQRRSRRSALHARCSPAELPPRGAMFLTIALLHVVGFGVFIAFVVPVHYKGLGIGIAVLAYSLGLRHAFDADHISAIDNTTRKLMQEGSRPLSVGYWFSLGHSTIVVAIGVGIVDRREGGLRRGLEQPLRARAVRRRLRHRRVGRVPVSDRRCSTSSS